MMLALVSCRVISAGPEPETSKILSVKDFGAKGDGLADDTPAIQAAIDAATTGTIISFPSGMYVVSNFVIKNRSGLSFVGEGRSSIIKQKPGAERIATFTAARDILIRNLSFDANGIKSYGGVMFYASTGVRIENNSFMDSAPKHNRAGDHYSFVFGKGAEPSRDIKIINNQIEFLQLEVDHSKNVLIEGNTVKDAIGTSGIGIFTVRNDAIAEDYVIKGNTVIDPPGGGFHIVTDPPSSRNCIFRRITIENNQLIRTKTSGYGIRLGTLNNSVRSTNNVFEDIAIKDNHIRIERAAPAPRPMIFANSSVAAEIVFRRLTVAGNTVENEGPSGGDFAIVLRRVQHSLVTDNVIKGMSNGISLSGALLENVVRDNSVEASATAYQIDNSLGQNRAFNNRVVGNTREKMKLSNMRASDSIEK
jgi:polygalacturonase